VFDFKVTETFLLGASLALYATFIYGKSSSVGEKNPMSLPVLARFDDEKKGILKM
jgi:hypothetical protein